MRRTSRGAEKMVKGWVWRNGVLERGTEEELVRWRPGRCRRKGLFETLKVCDGWIGDWRAHWQRLIRSWRLWAPGCLLSRREVETAVARVVSRARWRQGRLRILVWPARGRACFVVSIEPYPAACTVRSVQGWRATWASVRLKTTGQKALKKIIYTPFARESAGARAQGFDEVLFTNQDGYLVEGGRSNLFWVRSGCIQTPSLSCGCLPGVTREVVLDLLRSKGMPCRTGRFLPKALEEANEAFVTNSLIGIRPLVNVAGEPIGRGQPGPVTQRLCRLYESTWRQRAVRVSCLAGDGGV